MGYSNQIEQDFRDAIREANYTCEATYADMAANSGFKEGTLKAFVNNEGVHLPDERETLFCMARLGKWLSADPRNCFSVSRIFHHHEKHIVSRAGVTVDGSLANEIRDLVEEIGDLSEADRANNLTRLEDISKDLEEIVRAVKAEVAMKRMGEG